MTSKSKSRLSQEQYEAIYGRRSMGSLALMVWPMYFWWMREEIAKAETPKNVGLINSTPRAQQFWFVCGLVMAAPFVLVLMFLWTR